MTEHPGERTTVDRVLDAAFYAPLGLALSVFEAVPELARKGRDRLRPQVGLARSVGQLAVREGYKQFMGFANSNGPGPFGPLRSAPPGSGVPDASPGADENATNGNRKASILRLEPVRTPEELADDGLSAAGLAIPSYDSLSAPQVVQRLDGLSREEVAAVRAYESATRRRRTILTRADQILS
jgi:hypothetical protein